MNLSYFTLDFSPKRGGVARYGEALAAYFGARMTVVSHCGEDKRVRPVSYRLVPAVLLWKRLWPRWGAAVIQMIRHASGYDAIIVGEALPLGVAAFLAARITKKPYVVILHGMDVGLAKKFEWKRRLLQLVLSRAAVVVCNSKSLAAEVAVDFHIQPIVVYPSLVLQNQPAPEQAPAADGSVKILCVGRLVKRKGHERLIKSLALLRQEHLNFSCRIVGNGPEENALRSLVQGLGLDNRISVETGLSDQEIASAYAGADLFVMAPIPSPTDREGFGTVYLEAAACGVPSIATNMPGVDEAVLDGVTGILIGNDQELAEALWRLSTNREIRKRLGASAKDRVMKEFLPEFQFAKLDSELEKRLKTV